MAKQGYADRKDESLGMKNGPARKMKQDYQSRRDESYGMARDGAHEKAPKKCDPLAAQKRDMDRVKRKPMDHRGYPKEAFDYKY